MAATLPKKWEDHLAKGEVVERATKSLAKGEVEKWLAERPAGDMCGLFKETVSNAHIWFVENGADGAHDYARDVVWGLVRDALEGHSGIKTALESVRRSFVMEAGDRRGKSINSEWLRLRDDAVRKVAAEPAGDGSSGCPCATLAAGWEPEGVADAPDPVEKLADKYELQIQAKELAQQRRAASNWDPPLVGGSLAEQLKAERLPRVFAIESLASADANVMLIAQWKAGKTTLLGNLAKAAVDGVKFLDRYQVSFPDEATVVYFNLEVARDQMLDWLEKMDIENPERIHVEHLRGQSFPLPNKATEDWAVSYLMARKAAWWIVDPVGTMYEGVENDNTDQREFQKALDRIKFRAGIGLLVAAVHTGNAEDKATRARGGARQMDWADALWSYRHGGENGEIPPDSQRFLRAYGRDVDEPEIALEYEPTRRWMYADESGVSRHESRLNKLAEKAHRAVSDHTGEPLNAGSLKAKLGVSSHKGEQGSNAAKAIAYAVEQGWLLETKQGTSKLYTVGDVSPVVTDLRGWKAQQEGE